MVTNYISLVLENRLHDPNDLMLVDADKPERRVTHAEYQSMIKRIAVGLQHLGVQEQDGVGLVSNNDIYYGVFGDGVLAAGAVCVTIPTLGKQVDMGHSLKVGHVSWLFVAPEHLEIALLAAKEAGLDDSRVMVFDPPGREPYSGPRRNFSHLLATDEKAWKLPTCLHDPKSIARRGYTSGTTGAPKAAEVSHGALVAQCSVMIAVAAESPAKPRTLHNVQMFHPTGTAQFSRAALGHITFYLSASLDPLDALDRCKQFDIQALMFNPRAMDVFVAAIKDGTRSPDCLKYVMSASVGGGALRLDTLEALQGYLPEGAKILNIYGSTECGGISGFIPFPECKPPFVGRTYPNVDLKLIDPDTLQKVPNGTPGDICVRSPYLFSGYCGNTEATEKAFIDGTDGKGKYYRTGDKGYIDPATGWLAIVGRFSEVFKIGYMGVSEEVSPAEVEGELMKIAGVTDAAIVPTPSRSNPADHEPLAYIVRKAGSSLTAQQVVDHINSRMARHKVPEGGVLFVEALPRNGFGKVMRRHLEALTLLDGSTRYLNVSA